MKFAKTPIWNKATLLPIFSSHQPVVQNIFCARFIFIPARLFSSCKLDRRNLPIRDAARSNNILTDRCRPLQLSPSSSRSQNCNWLRRLDPAKKFAVFMGNELRWPTPPQWKKKRNSIGVFCVSLKTAWHDIRPKLHTRGIISSNTTSSKTKIHSFWFYLKSVDGPGRYEIRFPT